MTKHASETDVARNFSEYLDRVVDQGDSFILTRDGEIVAELRPLSAGLELGELPAFLASLPRLSEEEARAFAADIEAARAELASTPLRNPWES